MKTKAKTIYKTKEGQRVPGVTTIIGVLSKDALIEWANRIGLEGIEVRKYVDDKAAIGSLAHDMIICHLQGDKPDTSDYSANQIAQAENACLSYFAWAKSKKINLVKAEVPLVSEFYGFGGQFDIFAEVDSVLELIDIKSGSGIYPEHVTQVSAYKILMNENGFRPERIRILNVPRTENENWGELVVSDKQIEMNIELFKHCLAVYNLRKQIKGEVVYARKHEDNNA